MNYTLPNEIGLEEAGILDLQVKRMCTNILLSGRSLVESPVKNTTSRPN